MPALIAPQNRLMLALSLSLLALVACQPISKMIAPHKLGASLAQGHGAVRVRISLPPHLRTKAENGVEKVRITMTHPNGSQTVTPIMPIETDSDYSIQVPQGRNIAIHAEGLRSDNTLAAEVYGYIVRLNTGEEKTVVIDASTSPTGEILEALATDPAGHEHALALDIAGLSQAISLQLLSQGIQPDAIEIANAIKRQGNEPGRVPDDFSHCRKDDSDDCDCGIGNDDQESYRDAVCSGVEPPTSPTPTPNVTPGESGLIGSNFSIVTSPGMDYNVAISADNLGNFYVVWDKYNNPSNALYGRRVSSSGGSFGDELPISSAPVTGQYYGSISFNGFDRYLVSWNYPIHGQIINTNGQLIGEPIALSTEDGFQWMSTAGSFEQGDWIAAWHDEYTSHYHAQRISSTGVSLGDPIDIGPQFAASDYMSIAANNQGDVVMAWDEVNGAELSIYSRRVSASGATSETVAISTISSDKSKTGIAFNHQDRFLVVWDDNRSGNHDIYGQLMSSNGTLIGHDFVISSSNLVERYPAVTSDSNGNFIVAWNQRREGFLDIHAIKVSPIGQIVGDVLRIATQVAGDTTYSPPALATNSMGDTLAVWFVMNGPGDTDIWGQLIH